MGTDAQGGQAFLIKVREFLGSKFSREELEVLCFDLGVDPENVQGNDRGKEYWAQQIVLHFSRRDAITELVAKCRELRPNAPWSEINEERELIIEEVTAGVMALQELMQMPEVLREVAVLDEDMNRARDQLHTLRNYKELHDQLHELQFNFYIPAFQGMSRFPSDMLFLQDLKRYGQSFSDVIDALVDVINQNEATMRGERSWIERLEKHLQMLEEAQVKSDGQLFAKCLERVQEVIGVKPAEINGRLKDAMRNMSLSNFLLKLSALHENLSHTRLDDTSKARLLEFNEGIQSMRILWERLSTLVDEHDKWQEAEDQLKRLEAEPVERLYDEDDGWQDLVGKLNPLCRASSERWATRMLEDEQKLKFALDERNASRIAEVFSSYRLKAGSRFYVVDKSLLQECSRITEIGPKLDVVFKAS